MVNRVILVGYLGGDPEVRMLDTGVKVARVRMATTHNFRRGEQWDSITEWHNLVFWRQLAERAEQFHKGDLLYVEGKLSYNRWTDQEGNIRDKTEIEVRSVRRLLSRQQRLEAKQGIGDMPSSYPSDREVMGLNDPSTTVSENTDIPLEDDDLPF